MKQTYHVCPSDIESSVTDFVFCANDSGNQATPSLECPTFQANAESQPVGPTLSDSLLIPEQLDSIPSLVQQDDSKEPVHLDPQVKKVVKFANTRDICLFTQDAPSTDLQQTFSQVCSKVESSLKQIKPTLYIMSQVCSLDHSLREVFYRVYFTSPTANKLAVEEEEDDFYY